MIVIRRIIKNVHLHNKIFFLIITDTILTFRSYIVQRLIYFIFL